MALPRIICTWLPSRGNAISDAMALIDLGADGLRINGGKLGSDPGAIIAEIKHLALRLAGRRPHVDMIYDCVGRKRRVRTVKRLPDCKNLGREEISEGKHIAICKDHRRLPAPTMGVSLHLTLNSFDGLCRAEVGTKVFFQDGDLEGEITETAPESVVLRVDRVRSGSSSLLPGQGMNLRGIPACGPLMSSVDEKVIGECAEIIDWVSIPFVESADDVRCAERALSSLRCNVGMLLKIETRTALANIYSIAGAPVEVEKVGLVVARGDLALDIGWARLPAAQEQVMMSARAHGMKVAWATGVMGQCLRTGFVTHAEMSDASLGLRADQVWLNRGKHPGQALRTLVSLREASRPGHGWLPTPNHPQPS